MFSLSKYLAQWKCAVSSVRYIFTFRYDFTFQSHASSCPHELLTYVCIGIWWSIIFKTNAPISITPFSFVILYFYHFYRSCLLQCKKRTLNFVKNRKNRQNEMSSVLCSLNVNKVSRIFHDFLEFTVTRKKLDHWTK